MDTRGPISPISNCNSYSFVIFDAFSLFIITNPTPNPNSKHAIHTVLYHWITKFGPPQYLVTDRGTEYINQDMAYLCSLFHIKHSPRTLYSPKPMGSLKIKTASSELIFVYFYKTRLIIGQLKFKCTHTHIPPLQFQT